MDSPILVSLTIFVVGLLGVSGQVSPQLPYCPAGLTGTSYLCNSQSCTNGAVCCRYQGPFTGSMCRFTGCDNHACPPGFECRLLPTPCAPPSGSCPPAPTCVPAQPMCPRDSERSTVCVVECTGSSCPNGKLCCKTACGGSVCRFPDPCQNHVCPPGQVCREQAVNCVTSPCDFPPFAVCAANCAAVTCLVGNICDEETGRCVPANQCRSVSCPPGQVCELVAVQCVTAPCPPLPMCKPLHPCALVLCGPGMSCDPRTGQCVPVNCASITCPPGQVCELVRVQCVTTPCPPLPMCKPLHPCALVLCPPNMTCDSETGRCVPAIPRCPAESPGPGICAATCNSITGCQPGHDCCRNSCGGTVCVLTNRCLTVRCSAGYVCDPRTGTCVAIPRCPANPPGPSICVITCTNARGCEPRHECCRNSCGGSVCVPSTSDLCATVRCVAGTQCDPRTGRCVNDPNSCGGNPCPYGYYCDGGCKKICRYGNPNGECRLNEHKDNVCRSGYQCSGYNRKTGARFCCLGPIKKSMAAVTTPQVLWVSVLGIMTLGLLKD